MKILYVGNFRPVHSTETHLALTLEKLGHEVSRIQEDETGSHYLQIQLESIKPDMFLFTRTWGRTVTLEHLDWLRDHKIPSVSYHLDLYLGLQRAGNITTDPFWRTDYVFTPDGDPLCQSVFEQMGINHHYMKPGVFEDECYIVDLPQTHDVIFVGSYRYHPEWPYRQHLIQFLRRTYRQRFELYGHEEHTKIRNDELNQLYSSTKIVVGDSLCLGFKHQGYWSDRVYETPGRGGFLIQPYIKGLEEEFTDGENAVFYEFGNWQQLSEKIAYYHNNPDEREKIRLAAHEYVKANCTYTNRMKQMLEVIK